MNRIHADERMHGINHGFLLLRAVLGYGVDVPFMSAMATGDPE